MKGMLGAEVTNTHHPSVLIKNWDWMFDQTLLRETIFRKRVLKVNAKCSDATPLLLGECLCAH